MCQLNNTTELSSPEETRSEFNRSTGAIKLGIDVHQDFYVAVMQESGSNPKPPQRFQKTRFPALGGQTQGEDRRRSARRVRSVRIWLWIAALSERTGDLLLRGLSAKTR
jgi:hypothetical protein